ncbi:MAG: glycosyltransferase family 4 protein [Chloroflexi bacterium]|nr:glycosyltransferase family 4 protein [Chloroflexota bacterium]
MRIAIDYTPAVTQSAGIGRYTRSLVQALAEVDADNEYELFYAYSGRHKPDWPFGDHPNFVEKAVSISGRTLAILWHRIGLPLPVNLVVGNVAVFHATDFVLPPVRRSAGIVTVHDLSFILYPDHADSGLVSYLERAVPPSVRRARLVLADSENTRNDISCLLDAPPEKVEVLYAGVDAKFRRVEDGGLLGTVRQRYGLAWPFILSVGTIERRKNLIRLVQAYGRLRAKRGDLPKLLIVGRRGWLYEDVFEAVADLGLEDDIVFPGFVADDDLPALYSLAEAFVYPSLYEGFGLPPLEAMACGAPVVAANTSSLPEVLGDAYLGVAPTDVEALTAALERVLSDGELREDLRRRGLARAGTYAWQNSARRLVELYGRVVS